MTELERRKLAFIKLGDFLEQYIENQRQESQNVNTAFSIVLQEAAQKTVLNNSWFTDESLLLALSGIRKMLVAEQLDEWLASYPLKSDATNRKKLGVVMAGNIPLVGFHDFLCVLIQGHHFVGKLSSDDPYLLPALWNVLSEIEPLFKDMATFTQGQLGEFDAIIATGSDNTSRYFDYYFGKYPHIIRRNRNGVAVIKGDESQEDYSRLAADVFSYFGLGCRNVSFLLVPEGFDPTSLFQGFESYAHIAQHSKYHNNYMYNKSVLLINKEPHFDNGFLLLHESSDLASPVAVLHYLPYKDAKHLNAFLLSNKQQIQCIVSEDSGITDAIPFGQAQQPGVEIYADRVDTMQFLLDLK